MKTTDKEFMQTIRRILPDTTLQDVEALKANEAARQCIIAERGTLLFDVTATMYRIDPAGVAHDLNDEREYDFECVGVIQRLPQCKNAQDCAIVIHDECFKSFNGRVRSVEHYKEIGAAVWQVWLKHTSAELS